MRQTSHPVIQAHIDRHFGGRISPVEERSLRDHLVDCEGCRLYYERHLILAALDPKALGQADRLAIGLGLSRQRPRLRRDGLALALAAAALVLLGLAFLLPQRLETSFTARGPTTPPGVALLIYRVTAHKPPSLAGPDISSDDELAFAYRNAAGKARLLVFAVDDAGNVYWYYPAWHKPAENPRAVLIESGDALRELPEAVQHSIKGHSLRLFALFTDEALSVRDIETRVNRARGAFEPLSFPKTLQVTRSFAVRHGGGRQ